MVHPPQLPAIVQDNALAHVMASGSPFMFIVAGVVAVYLLYRFVFKALGKLATAAVLALLAGIGVVLFWLQGVITKWQYNTLHTVKRALPVTSHNGFVDPLTSGASTISLNAQSPLVHENAWLIAIAIIGIALWGLGFLIYRALSPTTRAQLMSNLRAASYTDTGRRKGKDTAEFPLVGVEIGVRKENGKPVVIDGKDRFINTLVLGSIGTGKTSRVLMKAAYQDIRSIADGIPMDVIVLDPDGGFAESTVNLAKKLHVHTDVIDLRGRLQNTVSFNPFQGGDLSDIIDNVRAALQEKMGKQDGFFQNAQDDLVRSVILVQVPLWPDTDFAQFANLVTDPLHFRAVCSMLSDCALAGQTKSKKKKGDDLDNVVGMWEHERAYIQRRYVEMNPTLRSMALTEARSFLMDTRSEQRLERLETITKGLKIVVNELATNPRLSEAFSTKSLPPFDFQAFLNTGKDVKGRLLVVITGNRPAGKLFGKLFLVTLKMYSLDRGGSEDTRRPVYLHVDEFPVFGTESFTEMFSQARKYRVGMMLALQARAQLLDVSKKFMDVVEGSCRNKVFFPAPSPDDARFLEHSLGTTTTMRETHSQNKVNWFGFDGRNLDRRVSTQETIDPRYRLEDIAYGLKKNEAVFALTIDNQAEAPFIGLTSYADEWVKRRRGFFVVSDEEERPAHMPRGGWFKKKQNEGAPVVTQQQSAMVEVAVTAVSDTGETTQTVREPIAEPTDREASEQSTYASYVRPDADPNVVIRMEDILRRTSSRNEAEVGDDGHTQTDESAVLTAVQEESDEPILQPIPTTDETPVVERIDLRIRSTNASTPSSETAIKMCPECKNGMLQLTADQRKWECPECGFTRRNRSAQRTE